MSNKWSKMKEGFLYQASERVQRTNLMKSFFKQCLKSQLV